jgi:hypothetical protein
MKLAEALILRSDLQHRTEQLKQRILREFTENKLPNFKIIPSYYKVL